MSQISAVRPHPRPTPLRRVRPAARASLALTAAFGVVVGLLAVLAPADAVSASTANGPALTAEPKRPTCGFTHKLVPKCGRLIGVAPMAHTAQPLATALPKEEQFAGRRMDIVHAYHVNDQLFPTATERKIALQRGANRLLLLNWKPSTTLSWRKVAQGYADARIDRLAKYIRSTFRHRFFLTIWHEPENDVRPAKGSGWTADDYAAMFRHVVSRLRADKITYAITVMNYMGFDSWARKSWFSHLWPGAKYVDWIATDPYGTAAAKSTYTARNLPTLINRKDGSFPGFYSWIKKSHPGKPMMLAEWGVAPDAKNPGGMAAFFRNVGSELAHYPNLKALVYFDMPTPPAGEPRTYLAAEKSSSLNAYRALGHRSNVVAPMYRYKV